MSHSIRDAEIDALATELMHRLGTKNKSEAVLRALKNELMRDDEKRPMADRVGRIQDRVTSRMGGDTARYDDKAYMDTMWEV